MIFKDGLSKTKVELKFDPPNKKLIFFKKIQNIL